MEYLEDKYFELNDLVNPKLFNSKLDLENEDSKLLEKNLQSMLLIRSVEKKLAEKKKEGIIRGPVHLGVGQEAIPVGISNSLTKNDRVFGAHRSHAHLLALGSDVQKLFAEILSRSTGHSKGMGGSMHLIDKNYGFHGSVPIVAGTIPIAVGSALAAKIDVLAPRDIPCNPILLDLKPIFFKKSNAPRISLYDFKPKSS